MNEYQTVILIIGLILSDIYIYNSGGQHERVQEPHGQIQLCQEPKYL